MGDFTAAQLTGGLEHKLQAALNIVTAHSHLYNWLFTDPDRPFHPGPQTLTPSTFMNSITLNLSHQENHDVNLNLNNNFAPLTTNQSMAMLHFTPSTTAGLNVFHDAANNATLNVDDVTECVLGYVYAAGNPKDAHSHPFGALPGVPGIDGMRATFHGRFVYDIGRAHLLFTLSGLGQQGNAGLISLRRVGNNRRERCFFSVQTLQEINGREHVVQQLTDRLLGGVSMVEYRVNDDMNNMVPPMPNTGFDVVSNANRINLSTLITKFRRELCGSFYAPSIVLDVISIQQDLQQPLGAVRVKTRIASGQLQSAFDIARSDICAEYRELTAQQYYAAGLSLVSENLVTPSTKHNVECTTDSTILSGLLTTSSDTTVPIANGSEEDVSNDLLDLTDFNSIEGNINTFQQRHLDTESEFAAQIESLMVEGELLQAALKEASVTQPKSSSSAQSSVGACKIAKRPLGKKPVQLLPRPRLLTEPAAIVATEEASPPGATESKQEKEARVRREKIEARKRQNRASSARRQEKLKLDGERRRKEIEQLRAKAEMLKKRKDALQKENAEMRVMVASRQVSGEDVIGTWEL